MSNFTTSIRNICQTYAAYADTDTNVEIIDYQIPEVFNNNYPDIPPVGRFSIDECISNAAPKIFNFYYPFYNPPTPEFTIKELNIFGVRGKERLERKILKHYYMREIGFETVGQFKLHLNAMLNDIMPKYNQMYYVQHLLYADKFNIFDNIDYTAVTTGTGLKENSGKTDNVSKSNNVTETNKFGSYTDTADNTQTYGSRTDIENTNDQLTGSSNSNTSTENDSQNNTNERAENSSSKTTNGGKTTTTYGQPSTHTLDKYSDTPQGSVNNMLTEGYLTNVRDTTETKDYGSVNDQNKNLHVKETYDGLTDRNTENKSDIKSGSTHEDGKSQTTANNSEEKTGNRENVYGGHTDTSHNDVVYGAKENITSKNNSSDDIYQYGEYTEASSQNLIKKVNGKNNNKSYIALLQEFLSIINNIDMLIITELEPLFMGLWE